MAIAGRNSEEKTVASKALYTGLGEFKVLLVNPTSAELSGIGINLQNEPTYVDTNSNDIQRCRLDFWVREETIPDFITKLSLWIDNSPFESRTGKFQYINKYGKTGWSVEPENEGDNPPDLSEYFKPDGVRKSFRGEESIHKFLAAYLNTVYDTRNNKYDECLLEKVENYFKNDFSELKEVVKQFKNNTVRLLCGVDDNGYQQTYNKFFEKTCVASNFKQWNKQLSGDYGMFKADFQDDYELKIYVPSAQIPTPSGGADLSTENIPNNVETSDEELL